MERGRMAFTLRAIAEESRPFTNVRPDCRPKATRGRDLLLARKTQVILPRSTFILNGTTADDRRGSSFHVPRSSLMVAVTQV